MLKKQRKHRIYSEDFKREAVAMYEASDKTLPEICRLLDISCESVLNRWRVLYGKPKSKRGCMSQTPKKPDNINEMSVPISTILLFIAFPLFNLHQTTIYNFCRKHLL